MERAERPRERTAKGGPDTRARILDAAAAVMRTSGLAQATTKQIARAAGCSEANLYKHFAGKAELFEAVLKERLPGLIPFLLELPGRAGMGQVQSNLEELALKAVSFYEAGMPMSSALYSEPTLLQGFRQSLRARGGGPQRALDHLTAYLRAEQDLGRVAAGANPGAAAALFLGACFQRAFLSTFMGEDVLGEPVDRFARDISRTLMRALR